MNKDKLLVFEEAIPADLENLRHIQGKLEEWAKMCSLSETNTFQWKLILTEAVTNAIRHGCRGIDDARLLVRMEISENTIVIEIKQPGPGPTVSIDQPVKLPDDPLSENGRGLFIIEQFADEVEHWHSSSGYKLILKKHYPEPLNPEMGEEMQEMLNELSSCYESLSAYNRLGEQLLDHESLTNFINETIENLKIGHSYENIIICPSSELPPKIRERLTEGDSFLKDAIIWKTKPEQVIWDDQIKRPEFLQNIVPHCDYGMVSPVFCQRIHVFDAIVTFEMKDSMSSQSVNLFTSIAELLGLSVGIAILQEQRENQIRQQREWEIATQLQQSLLPIQSGFKNSDMEINLFHRAAGETAGDYAIVFQSPNNEDHTYLAIIDVMGKGIRAALLAILFKGAFQLLVSQDRSPEEILFSLNNLFCNMLGRMVYFITAVVCRFDKHTEEIEWSNAGHCNFLGFTPDKIQEGVASGPPLGVVENSTYKREVWNYTSVEHLALFTDGCYEWDRKGEVFDSSRFENFLHERQSLPKNETWEILIEMIESKVDSQLNLDDITLILGTITNK